MNFVYVPSEYLIVREAEGAPSEASERVIATTSLPQAVAAWASLLESGRFIEIKALPFPVPGQPIVRVRTSIEVLPRDISLLLGVSPDPGQGQMRELASPRAFVVASGEEDPILIQQVASLSQQEGQWTVEIWDLTSALPGLKDQIERLKKEGYVQAHLGLRVFAGFLSVTTAIGVGTPYAGDLWLSVGQKRGSVDLLAMPVDTDDSSRLWRLEVGTAESLFAVAMAFEKIQKSAAKAAALDLVISWQ